MIPSQMLTHPLRRFKCREAFCILIFVCLGEITWRVKQSTKQRTGTKVVTSNEDVFNERKMHFGVGICIFVAVNVEMRKYNGYY